MIVVDASAICAILFRDPDAAAFVAALRNADELVISPVNLWEAHVSVHRRLESSAQRVRKLVADAGMVVAAIGVEETELAFEAWRRFGKGRHAAGLNLGDCFAYALAKSRALPLLYKGDDFAKTDVASAF